MDKKYIDERETLLLEYIKQKSVLDLGVGDTSDRFLHKFISNNTKSVLGLELDKNRAEKLKSMGYNIIQGNAETLDLGERFDVIVAGDLIEHLNNVGLFLENVKKHIKKDGVFIFNTPNAYSINFILRGLFLGGYVKQFEEHTLLFTEELIDNLLSRYGFKIEKIIYFTHKEKKLKSWIIRLFTKLSKKRHENMFFIVKI